MKPSTLILITEKLMACALVLGTCCVSPAYGKAGEPTAIESGAKAESNANGESKSEMHGVSLGEYRIRSYYPVDAQKSTVRFTLFATAKGDHFAEVQKLAEEHREKIRDQVIAATRLAPLAVFQEPDLASFRRRVLVRLRRALPELTIDELYVSEFDLTIKSL